jgi:hypothetical protein
MWYTYGVTSDSLPESRGNLMSLLGLDWTTVLGTDLAFLSAIADTIGISERLRILARTKLFDTRVSRLWTI